MHSSCKRSSKRFPVWIGSCRARDADYPNCRYNRMGGHGRVELDVCSECATKLLRPQQLLSLDCLIRVWLACQLGASSWAFEAGVRLSTIASKRRSHRQHDTFLPSRCQSPVRTDGPAPNHTNALALAIISVWKAFLLAACMELLSMQASKTLSKPKPKTACLQRSVLMAMQLRSSMIACLPKTRWRKKAADS